MFCILVLFIIWSLIGRARFCWNAVYRFETNENFMISLVFKNNTYFLCISVSFTIMPCCRFSNKLLHYLFSPSANVYAYYFKFG